jgi:arylsulfatase A-like enzyme
MNRREFCKCLGLGAAAVGLSPWVRAADAAAAPARKPNVIFILADDLGWRDTSLYGSTFYETPNVERLAKRGMMFTNAYAANPLCSPTRASIQTGLWPARIGITAPVCHMPEEKFEETVAERGPPGTKVLHCVSATRLKLEYYTLAEAFHDGGYRTGHFGKWHLGQEPYDPLHQGYDVDVPHWGGPGPAGSYVGPWKFPAKLNFTGAPGEHIEDRMASEAAKFLKENKDRPFFMTYWCFSVHSPWDAKKEYVEKYRAKADPKNAQRNPLYAAMVRSMDDAVGRLLATLDELGLAENTIVVFFSDNGGVHWAFRKTSGSFDDLNSIPITSNAPLRGGKATIYEGGTREPCIVVWPGQVKPGSKSDAVIQSIDFYPTILEMAGLAPKQGLKFDGTSIVPALRGAAALPREAIFCHFPHATPATGQLPAVYVRKGEWKLIRFFHDGPNFAHRYELYNLKTDVSETTNLADDMPDRVKELDALIEGFLKQSGAVLPKPNPAYSPGVQGWVGNKDAALSVKDGLLVIESTGLDPNMSTRNVPKNRGAAIVEFRMRSSAAGQAQIYWGAEGMTPLFIKDRSVLVQVMHDGQWHEYSEKLPIIGTLSALRIDPANAQGRIEIEWIRLRGLDDAVLVEWNFAKPVPQPPAAPRAAAWATDPKALMNDG